MYPHYLYLETCNQKFTKIFAECPFSILSFPELLCHPLSSVLQFVVFRSYGWSNVVWSGRTKKVKETVILCLKFWLPCKQKLEIVALVWSQRQISWEIHCHRTLSHCLLCWNTFNVTPTDRDNSEQTTRSSHQDFFPIPDWHDMKNIRTQSVSDWWHRNWCAANNFWTCRIVQWSIALIQVFGQDINTEQEQFKYKARKIKNCGCLKMLTPKAQTIFFGFARGTLSTHIWVFLTKTVLVIRWFEPWTIHYV